METPKALAEAHHRRLRALRAMLQRSVDALWTPDGLTLDLTVRRVLTGQRAAVRLTDAYMAAAARAVYGYPVPAVGLNAERLIGRAARNGIPLEQVYARVAVVAAASDDDTARSYLRQQVSTDVNLAQRLAAGALMWGSSAVTSYRRVTGGGQVCARCVAASTQTYRSETLQPIHRGCGCTVSPVFNTARPPVTSRDSLEAVYADGVTTFAAHQAGVLSVDGALLPPNTDAEAIAAANVRIVEDPELGPTLDADRHDHVA